MITQDTQLFVGRDAELDGLLQAVAGLRRGAPPQRCLFNLCGAHGIGKSALLSMLRRRLAGDHGLRVLSLRLPPCAPGLKEPPLEVRQLILAQLSDAEPAADESTADTNLATLAHALGGSGAPVVLLAEADQRSAPTVFGWVERGLLLPLTRSERVVAVVASRSPLRWREFDTRRRAEVLALGPLGLADTAAQLGLALTAAEVVARLTAGHPLANELARPLLSEGRDPAGWDAATEAELARRISDALYERIGPGLTSELHCALEALAVVREFALPLLRSLLAFCDEPSTPRSQAVQLQLVKQLQELDLVLWDQASLSYRVTPVIRRLIGGALRRADLAYYDTLRRAALAYYRQMLDEVLVSRHVHLLELLWHTLDGDDPVPEGPAELLQRLVHEHLSSPDGKWVATEPLDALRLVLADDSELAAALRRRGSDLGALISALEPL